ncbi:MAG: nuclear transport factor 2 family protein [Armatimonadota bacterium]|nr:nuclear transport factor 2 family protein [Armatimonadota bacterium]
MTTVSLFCGSALPALTHGNDSASPCRQIQETYVKRYAAYSRRDASGYLALFAPDYVWTDHMGKRNTFAVLRKEITSGFSRPLKYSRTPYQVEYKIARCSVTGDAATVNARVVMECAIYRPHSPQVDHYYYAAFMSKDVWQRGANGWVLKRRKALSEQHGWPKHKPSL